MNTSSLELLQAPEKMVLAAGHGGADPGATSGNHKLRDRSIVITAQIAT